MKRVKLKTVLSLLLIGCISSALADGVNAANTYIPELNVYQQGSSPKIEVVLDIAPEDVIYKIDFEDSSNIRMDFNGRGTGGQSIQSNVKYSGNKAYKLVDTITGETGNYTPMSKYPYTRSLWTIRDKYLLTSDKWFAVSCKMNVNSATQTTVNYNWDTIGDKTGHPALKSNGSFDLEHTSKDVIRYANSVDWNSGPPEYINVQDKNNVNLSETIDYRICTYNGGDNNYGMCNYYWDNTNKRFYRADSYITNYGNSNIIKTRFNAGDKIYFLRDVNGTIGNRVINGNTNGWETFSSSMNVKNPYYDWENIGANFRNINGTDGVLYIDDIKFGFASQIQLQRNGAVISTDYDYDIVDSGVVITPNKPSVTKATTNADNVLFNFKADKKTETHKYKARSKSNATGTWSAWSSEFPVTLTSTIKGYSVKVDKSTSTDPGKTQNNTNGSITVKGYKEGDVVYCHVRAVDTNGQWSSPIHYKYIVKQTAVDLKEDVSVYAKKLSVNNATDINSIKAQITKLRTNNNIPYNITKMNKSNATKYNKGKIEFTTSISGQSQSSTTPIMCKPIYQTEQELKEDITDYIGQTSIHNNNKQLPDTLSYEESKGLEALEQDIVTKCKTNPDLKDIEIEFSNSATEFSSGKLQGEIYLNE